MAYGIANSTGQPSIEDTTSILSLAHAANIYSFDTATSYGEAENRLGLAFRELRTTDRVKIMTKLSVQELGCLERAKIAAQASMSRLGVRRLSVVYAHSYSCIMDRDSRLLTSKILATLKDEGYCEQAGISVYSAAEALHALDLDYIEVVQMPLNVLDRQAVNEKVIDFAIASEKTIFFRSIFLQGLLLMDVDSIPQRLAFAKPYLSKWTDICEQFAASKKFAAMQIAKQLARGMPLIIGCESQDQLRENIELHAQSTPTAASLVAATAELSQAIPDNLSNPAKWPQS
jgi:aryl-alcohol dehydrogenase-like predicted oxidoreductase